MRSYTNNKQIMLTITHSIILTFYIFLFSFVNGECPIELDCDFCLTNDDFLNGTYRILESGKFCLSEDIIFNPRQPDDLSSPNSDIWNWYPGGVEGDDQLYPGTLHHRVTGPFAAGFFAAISIEYINIEIDLNGHSIEQHPYFYTQQRFYSNIEVQNKPYDELSKRTTGVWMWGPNAYVDNIYIHNGELGLSSHHGIHSNGATNVVIEDLIIHDFEVGGIQFNDFSNVTLRNIEIGPSATNVKLTGYYGNARYDRITLEYIENYKPESDYVTFSDGRTKTVLDIKDDLIEAMDIAFRYANDELTEDDLNNPLYQISMDLFSNEANGNLPDGSTIYGVLFNSFMDAVQGFGQINQYGGDDTVIVDGLILENVYIHDLQKAVNEVPAVYMNQCYDNEEDWSTLYQRQNDTDVVRTPLGSTIDLRIMIEDGHNVIDSGLLTDKSLYSEYLKYKGNVLSDAQIAISLYSAIKSRINTIMEDWATESTNNSIAELPQCVAFICNSDIIFQTNKGIIGFRLDEIQNVKVRNLTIDNLQNYSPLGSNACGNYSGASDGGNVWQINGEGNMNGDVRGISIYGSSVNFDGNVNINNLYSSYGDVYGIHIMIDSYIEYEDSLMMTISDLYPENALTEDKLNDLLILGQSPYPNNFNGKCNILIDKEFSNSITIDPLIPFGVDDILCESPDNLPQIKPRTVNVDNVLNADNALNAVKFRKIDYIDTAYNMNRLYMGISAIFVIGIGGFIFCIVQNYRNYMKRNDNYTDNDGKKGERTRFIINYGAIRREH